MRFSTELQVHLGHLAFNFDQLNKLAPKNEIIFMIKANAYGHGLLEIAHYAFHELKVKRFGCASLGEAVAIREKFPKMQCEIFVFSDTEICVDQLKEHYLNYNIVPVIHNFSDLKIITSDKNFSHLPLVIKLDTGMHRLGSEFDEIERVSDLLLKNGRRVIHHFMTHFASSYQKLKNGDRTYRQYDNFKKAVEQLRAAGIEIEETSCANSGAIEQKFTLEESHIRPGLMLYGPSATGDRKLWSGKTISTFKTQVLKVTPVKRGTPIGYGGHVCGKDGFIVYLPVGYGDGLLTYYSGAKFTFMGEKIQILGRVNMDLTAIFIEKKPAGLVEGCEFTLWNDSNQDISELAAQAKTIPYQIFTAVTARVPRRYIK